MIARALLALLVGAGCACSPAVGGTWTRPAPGRAPPEASGPALSATALASERPPIVLASAVLLHQVAIDAPDRSDVMVGRIKFPTADTYELVAQAHIGMRLFTVGWDGERWTTDVAGPLQGRFPAEKLARDIGRTYLAVCPVGSPVARPQPEGDYVVRCTLADGAKVEERLDPMTLELRARAVEEPDGHQQTIEYTDYGWYGPLWHPRTIRMRTGNASVHIALSGVEFP